MRITFSIILIALIVAQFQSGPDNLLIYRDFTDEYSDIEQSDLDYLANFVYLETNGENVRRSSSSAANKWDSVKTSGVYLSFRSKGKELTNYWTGEGKLLELIKMGIDNSLIHLSGSEIDSIDTVEICISHNYSEVSIFDLPENVQRGILGLKLTYGSFSFSFSPTLMVAKNLDFEKSLGTFLDQLNVSTEQFLRNGSAELFQCWQAIIFFTPQARTEIIERGNQLVRIETVNLISTRKFADLASQWLANQIAEDGRMTYLYWPSREEESNSNNMIRQWMATLALDRIVNYYGQISLVELSQDNIEYNLNTFFIKEGELGLIEWNDEVKLGSVSLAALSILEHPRRNLFKDELNALTKTTEFLYQENGSFNTFYRPLSRVGEAKNYYPGETLLFWSKLYEQSRDPELLERIMLSFRYYRRWHRENTNPAFIPWHTQAYYNVWLITKDPELRDFIFEMNDWLVEFQQLENLSFPDTEGRFYDPDKSYGPPHASSTGVYLEGLVDAYLLAKETGDSERQETYANAIRYGIRSLMQLQFVNDIDMYYIHQTENVLGGLRTTVYDNSIRIDNVQHGLMAVLKILSISEAQSIFQ